MTKKNPFPGMNPFFEQRWPDAHTMLIGYIRDALQEPLPEDLVAGAEEELVAVSLDEDSTRFRPDVSIKEPWENSGSGGVAVAAPVLAPQSTVPTRFLILEEVERWIEIRDTTGRLVTVLEIISPSNKGDGEAREKYRNKRRALISGGVNLVEIDLVRQGASLFMDEIPKSMKQKGAAYGVSVFRASRPGEREVYLIGLRDPLPVISVPLRPADADVPLDLQPLIDRCHERGRYHLLRYDIELQPPLAETDREWLQNVLRQNELIK